MSRDLRKAKAQAQRVGCRQKELADIRMLAGSMLDGFKEQWDSSVTSEEGTRGKVLGKGHRDRVGLGGV